MISLLVGLTLPTRGGARVLGHDIVKESVEIRRKVGLLPEGFGFYGGMTALDNLLFLGELDGIPRAELKERAAQTLDTVGLKELSERKVSTFSRGMNQRLGIAQALLKDPDLLILDEPTVGVDIRTREYLYGTISELAKEGISIILMSSDLKEVLRLSNRVLLMRKGRIVAEIPADPAMEAEALKIVTLEEKE